MGNICMLIDVLNKEDICFRVENICVYFKKKLFVENIGVHFKKKLFVENICVHFKKKIFVEYLCVDEAAASWKLLP